MSTNQAQGAPDNSENDRIVNEMLNFVVLNQQQRNHINTELREQLEAANAKIRDLEQQVTAKNRKIAELNCFLDHILTYFGRYENRHICEFYSQNASRICV